ncbi:lysosomal protective protein-like [Brevipalpus obovatus]|uniref:lysosomal protective protein-like n=1 Tax=Brevipalpus obovatus TaxID=246614 RepID=UPI003D9E6BEB
MFGFWLFFLVSFVDSLYTANIKGTEIDDVLVTSFPGIGHNPFNLYSGYVHIDGGKHFHYMFAESMNDPAKDPVVLWLNGGPGCSSMIGFWTENGPFKFDRYNGSITVNEYAWNSVANMLYLESPAGVGYSFSDSNDYSTNDDQTSLDNLNVVKAFFEKYPQYRGNDFLVTGEGYAAIYVPTLSVLLLNEPSINFKGFAIGGGLLD